MHNCYPSQIRGWKVLYFPLLPTDAHTFKNHIENRFRCCPDEATTRLRPATDGRRCVSGCGNSCRCVRSHYRPDYLTTTCRGLQFGRSFGTRALNRKYNIKSSKRRVHNPRSMLHRNMHGVNFRSSTVLHAAYIDPSIELGAKKRTSYKTSILNPLSIRLCSTLPRCLSPVSDVSHSDVSSFPLRY